MKAFVICLAAWCLPVAALAQSGGEDDLQMAREAIAALAGSLQYELVKAMGAGGPLNAIEVCHVRAAEISQSVSRKSGMQVGRVSLKNRNPANAPNDWQKAVLATFEARIQAGESPGGLSWHEKPSAANGQEFRFMKAIPTAEVCLACHGETIAEPVAAKIAQLYPEDRATGYRAGDIRGAFVVTRSEEPAR